MRKILKENFSKWNWYLARCSMQRDLYEERSRVMKMHCLKLGVGAAGFEDGVKESHIWALKKGSIHKLGGDCVGVCIFIVVVVIIIYI